MSNSFHKCKVEVSQGSELASIRVAAMKGSLEAIGRFDETRARARFLDSFDPDITVGLMEKQLIGFYVLRSTDHQFVLDHLYLKPEYQGRGIGSIVICGIIEQSIAGQRPIVLNALRRSSSNDFYQKHGFVKTGEDDYDFYYTGGYQG